VKLGITEFVDCAHFLPGHPQCGQMHGHTYKVELVVEGEKRAGMIVDFAELRSEARLVLSEYDHRCWNDFLEFPSVESICELLCERLRQKLRFPFVLRVWEGNGKWAETQS
jgi:6-pyruvoyltetrahydropterin/6-carboxytetrahydropterin synthase